MNESLLSKILNETSGQSLKDLLEPFNAAIGNLPNANGDHTNAVKRSSSQLKTEYNQLEVENLREINASLHSKIQKLTENEQQLVIKCNDQNRMLSKQMMFNKELAMKIEDLHKQHESYKAEHSKHMKQLLSEETANLEAIHDAILEQFNCEIKERIAEQRTILLHELTYETEELKRCIDEKQDQLCGLSENLEQLQAQMVDKDKTIHSLKRSLDDATLQTSKAVLERTKYMNERDSL